MRWLSIILLGGAIAVAFAASDEGQRGQKRLESKPSRRGAVGPIRRGQRPSLPPPPYAVQMEPLVQYSQRDPLYHQKLANGTAARVDPDNSLAESSGPPYPEHRLFDTEQYGPQYYSEPEPIIEIIVKESDESLPPPPPVPTPRPTKEPVHVFYVKYKKNPNPKEDGSDDVIYEPPVPALTPPTPDHVEEEPVTEPVHVTHPPPLPATTLRTVIRPDSEVYHGSGLRITFGGPDVHRADEEQEEQSAPEPRVALPAPETPAPTHQFKRQRPYVPQQFHFRPEESFGPRLASPDQRQHQVNQNDNRPAQNRHQSTQYQTLAPQHPTRHQPLAAQHQVLSSPYQTLPSQQPLPTQHQPVPTQHQPAPTQHQSLQVQHQQSSPQHQSLPARHEPQHRQPLPSLTPHHQVQQTRPQARPEYQRPQQQFPQRLTNNPTDHHETQFQEDGRHRLPIPTPAQIQQYQQQKQLLHQRQQQAAQQRHQYPFGGGPFERPAQQNPQPVEPIRNHRPVQQVPLLQQFSGPTNRPSEEDTPTRTVPQRQKTPTFTRGQSGIDYSAQARPQQQRTSSPRPEFQSSLADAEIVKSISQSEEHQIQPVGKVEDQYRHQPQVPPATQTRLRFGDRPRPQNTYTQSHTYRPVYTTTTTSRPTYTTPRPTAPPSPSRVYSPTPSTTEAPTEGPTDEKKSKANLAALPDEVPDDLREQLLSSGILGNADIQILDYDKVGDIPIENLPPEALENLYGAGSAPVPSVVKPDESDEKPPVEMKVVRYDPNTKEGQDVAETYLREDATRLDPVVLNDSRYNRYLPLKVSGSQFPIPDAPQLKGRIVNSVVVLAPVDYDFIEEPGEDRTGRAIQVQGVRFIAGQVLKDLVKEPTSSNYNKWLEKEKTTSTDRQSVVLLVTREEGEAGGSNSEIFMYDISSGKVSKLRGELSAAFVQVAESNSESKDLEGLSAPDL